MVLYRAGLGLGPNATEIDRQKTESTQQGRPGSILGPVTLGWWARVTGSLVQGWRGPRHLGSSLVQSD